MDQILDHELAAKQRVLGQFKGVATSIESLAGIVGKRAQVLETVIFDLIEKLWFGGSGDQLDQLGEILGLPRPRGLADAQYVIRLRAQVHINISCGDIERIILFMRLLTGATSVQLLEYKSGAISVMVNVAITDAEIDEYAPYVERVALGGVKVHYLGRMDATEPFAFAGPDPQGKGFGSKTNAALGGKFAAKRTPQ